MAGGEVTEALPEASGKEESFECLPGPQIADSAPPPISHLSYLCPLSSVVTLGMLEALIRKEGDSMRKEEISRYFLLREAVDAGEQKCQV